MDSEKIISSSEEILLELKAGADYGTSSKPPKSDKNKRGNSSMLKKLKSVTRGIMVANYIAENFNMKNGDVEIPSDCHGDIEFKETTKSTTAKFIRISDRTDVKQLYTFMTTKTIGWNLPEPRLLISVTGGAKSFVVDSRLKKNFEEGLAKVASTPGAWVVSGGTNTGVMKMVGDANYGTNNTCIGIVTWGIVANKEGLLHQEGKSRRYDYHLNSYLAHEGCAYLDYNHSHFLLVDDGSENKFGREIEFRGRFDDISSMTRKLNVPTVLLVVEGGPGTLMTIRETSVKNNIPCVLIKGSGRVADILVNALKMKKEIKSKEEKGEKHAKLLDEIKEISGKAGEVEEMYSNVLECLEKNDIFTVAEYDGVMDTDDAILTALLRNANDKPNDVGSAPSPSHYERLRLTILWNRVDLAESKVLAPLNQWVPEAGSTTQIEFNKLVIMALALNRTSFVKLLLDYGISLKKAVTRDVLEFLHYCYGSYLVKADYEARPVDDPPDEYKSLYEELLSYDSVGGGRGSRKWSIDIKAFSLSDVQQFLEEMILVRDVHIENLTEKTDGNTMFKDPFLQLFLWALTNNLLEMSLFFWQFLDHGIATSLIASEVMYNMKKDARFKGTNSGDEGGSLENTFDTFTKLSIDLMNTCYTEREEDTEIIVTNRIGLFAEKSSCLEFAVATQQEDFVAQPAIQGLLDEVWYGSIKATDTSLWRIMATIIFPFLLLDLDIRSKAEIDKMNEINDSEEVTKIHYQRANSKAKKKRKADNITIALPLHKKFINFHVYSPVVRFFAHTFGYLLFLMLLSYVAMVEKTTTTPGWTEILVIITVFGFLVAEVYQCLHADSNSDITTRIVTYMKDVWNMFDWLCIFVFILALILRCHTYTLPISHLFYGIDVSLWILRLIQVLYVDEVTGPYVVMIGQMMSDMFKFLIILLIFLLSYGIGVKSFLNPTPASSQMLVQAIFHPYFHIHGEYFLDDPENGTTIMGTPMINEWQEPLALFYLGVYLLITNILLLNLLIAIFSSTYERVITNSSRIWKFRRCVKVFFFSIFQNYFIYVISTSLAGCQ